MKASTKSWIELKLADEKTIKVHDLLFVVDDDPALEPVKWRLAIFDPRHLEQLQRFGLAEKLD